MNHIAAVGFGERVGDFERELERLIERQRSPADKLLERLAVDVLHHEEKHIFGFVNFVDRADVRVIDGRCGASLSEETASGFVVTNQLGGKCFDGNCSVKFVSSAL